ncbi:MAG: hypothetical protein J5993_03720 [Clostridia bacterium]|nr:hypothetical protein [Clostridia bacterium]
MENLDPVPQNEKEEKESTSKQREKKNKTTDELIAENSKYFSFYEKAPKIFTIILGIVFFICSIVFSYVAEAESENAGLVWILSILIGSVICVATYYLLKLTFSYIILHICYLKKIEENTKKEQ